MTAPDARPRRPWRLGPGIFRARRKLVAALGLGVAVAAGAALLAPQARATTYAIAGWDAFCATYLVLVAQAVRGKGPEAIRARAAEEDQGQAVILALVLAACAASIVAVGVELSLAKGFSGAAKALYVAAAFTTVAASWVLMQVVFALHYAHEYYATDPATGRDAGGLAFPGGEPPDYWDFVHFSIVLAVAAQTADIAFTDKRMRRLGTAHSLLAFLFNTLILALTINLVAGLF